MIQRVADVASSNVAYEVQMSVRVLTRGCKTASFFSICVKIRFAALTHRVLMLDLADCCSVRAAELL